MSTGIYGAKKLANISINDVDILYTYSPDSQTVTNPNFQPLYSNVTSSDLQSIIGANGVYNLRLPAGVFNNLGFYTILIKPKTIQLQLVDCGYVITNNANQTILSKKGIVIPAAQFQNSGSLVGYQIEYYDTNNVKINNLSRIVTSSDLVSLSTNNNSIAPGSTAYVLDQGGSFYFCTVSPDEPSLINSSAPVDIGSKGQTVDISNTFFDPIMIEVEMVDATLETLSYILTGPSTKDNETGVLTYYDENNNIYRQYNLYETKKTFSNGTVSVKQPRTIVNTQANFQSISQGLTTS